MSAALDRSTAQIGAPDVGRPCIAATGSTWPYWTPEPTGATPIWPGGWPAAEDFSGSGSTGDKFGHGTHVASVVGGSGVGSGSTRRGVAPGARLLVGKVLGDDGFGSSSQVIAGMEWAVEQGADVVNMSLGSSGAGDGTDPMSLALNDLSRRTGALFVVAAGNDGEQGPRTVGSPTDRRLLSLLVAGVSDKTIASQMQLSRRTVQRRIQRLMERSDAATRMQLAWHAARHGWL
ncbi:S8 family serine peptidase [Streptomyces rubiginosohelvolus]|uniref:S8 family serine peptidase n=1 Tax=Streptomyces rubiginosohelvolus TaxID=67362 RepID=UPI00364C2D0E